MSKPAAPASSYTLKRVQAMLGLSRHVVVGMVREGFVTPTRGPRNAWCFSFQDLVLLRTAYGLGRAHIAPRKILRALSRLRASLPSEVPLSGLRISALGSDVVVRERGGTWAADTGQLLLEFDVAPCADSFAFAPAQAAAQSQTAEDWLQRGQALEAGDVLAAEAAYRRSIALAPTQADAYLNLGALYCEAGRFEEALALCDQALLHCAPSAPLHFNRALALDQLARMPQALAAYECCLMLDDKVADAHYNIARLHEQLGNSQAALRHFNAYRRLAR